MVEGRGERWRTTRKGILLWKGGAYVTIEPKLVRNPGRFGNAFKRGERVGEVHIDFIGIMNPERKRDARNALEGFLRSHEHLMDKFGFKGYFSDTPNAAVINYFRKAPGNSLLLDPPLLRRAELKLRYSRAARKWGYPAKYVGSPVKRIVFGFQKAHRN